MVLLNNINLLKRTSKSYELIQLHNKEVKIPDLVSLYKNKYTTSDILNNKLKLISLVEERISIMKQVLSYLLNINTDDFNILNFDFYINNLDVDKAIMSYNKVLTKEYKNMEKNIVDMYLIDKYKTMEYASFVNKEYIESEDFMLSYLMTFFFDYKCYSFFYSELFTFFNDLSNKENKINLFFSFFFFQYEYYFFLYTLYSFLRNNTGTKLDESYIEKNICNSSMLLNFSFSRSNKGLYHSSNDLSSPFMGFLELHLRDLYLFVNNPNINIVSFSSYFEQKYGDVIYPFCIMDNKNEIVFYYTENMIDFDYMQDFINSYLRYVLNSDHTRLHSTILTIKEELSNIQYE